MREKRKRGSTVITVLAVSLIFMALSGVILKSISSTMKSNINQKEREDLRYAAESGLEIARSHIEEKGVINKEIIDEINTRLERNLTNSLIERVKVVSPEFNSNIDRNININSNNKINLKIRAEKMNNSDTYEEVSVNYKLSSGINNDIFNHGLVAGKEGIGINTENSNGGNEKVDLTGTSISVNAGAKAIVNGVEVDSNRKDYGELKPYNLEYEDTIIMRKKTDGNIDLNLQFGISTLENIEFFSYEQEEEKNITPTYLEIDLNKKLDSDLSNIEVIETDRTGKKISIFKVDELKNKKLSAVTYMNIKGLNNYGYPYLIILTNCNDMKLSLSKGTIKLVRSAFLSTGNVFMYGEGTMHMNFSTIFGNKIEIEASKNIAIDGFGNTPEEGMDKNNNNLNMLMENLFENWNKSSDGMLNKVELVGDFSN